jgi:hypothetical protein
MTHTQYADLRVNLRDEAPAMKNRKWNVSLCASWCMTVSSKEVPPPGKEVPLSEFA